MRKVHIFLGFAFIILFSLAIGCGGGGGAEQDLPGPSTSVPMSVYLATNRIFVDVARGPNGANLAARVVDGAGRPIANATVRFTTDLGWFNNSAQSYMTITGTGGLAFTTLTSDSVGQAQARVEIPDSYYYDVLDVFFTLESVQSARIDLMADPHHVSEGGAVTITARLSDENNQPIPFTNITFTYENSTIVAQTNLDGVASVILGFPHGLSGTESLLVFASADFPFGTITEFITLTAPPIIIPSDGVSLSLGITEIDDETGEISIPVTASVIDENGNPVEGAAIRFSANAGQIVGFAVTNDDGQASAAWYLGAYTGQATLTAFIGTVSDSVTVNIIQNLLITPATVTLRETGQYISFEIFGGVPPYTIDLSDETYVEWNFSLSSGHGVLQVYSTSMPLEAVEIAIYVVDSVGTTATAALTLAPTAAPILILAPSATSFSALGESQTFIASGGIAPYTFILSHPQYLSGVQSGNTYTVTVTTLPVNVTIATLEVIDASGVTDSSDIILNPAIGNPGTGGLTITASGGATQFATGDVIQFFATGGTPPYTWNANGGLWDTDGDSVGDSATTNSVSAQPVMFVAGNNPGTFLIYVTDVDGNGANYQIEIR